MSATPTGDLHKVVVLVTLKFPEQIMCIQNFIHVQHMYFFKHLASNLDLRTVQDDNFKEKNPFKKLLTLRTLFHW